MAGSIHAHLLEGLRIHVRVISDNGASLSLIGERDAAEPVVETGGVLEHNVALRSNMWAFAKAWYRAYSIPHDHALCESEPEKQHEALKLVDKERELALKHARTYAKTAQWIADVADDLAETGRDEAWCSSCFFKTQHLQSNRSGMQLTLFVCQGCGSPTASCVVPACENMATRGAGALNFAQFCAEHRHAIPGFEKSQGTFGELHEYEEYLQYEKQDLAKVSKVAAGSALVLGAAVPLAFLAAPAVGGAIGSMGLFGGLSGAAATSHGLALLGGGTIAAGGLGMAGGTAAVTAVGAAVGGVLGASIANAYLREDKSFRIELIRPGNGGTPVVVANGFLTGGQGNKWGGWKKIVTERYPESPVYRVHWGAKELRDFGVLFAESVGKNGLIFLVKNAAATATKVGAKGLAAVAGPAFLAADLAKNPWHLAKSRADKTGVLLGDLLARTDAESYVLIGHSLGARAMVVAAQTLGTKSGGPRIQSAHLLGAAIGAKSDWSSLVNAVDDGIYAYHSKSDQVLKYVYKIAQAGETAAGLSGFKGAPTKLRNVDVSVGVGTHFDYQDNVQLM